MIAFPRGTDSKKCHDFTGWNWDHWTKAVQGPNCTGTSFGPIEKDRARQHLGDFAKKAITFRCTQ
ncbi:hypothetical protein MAPG_06053 [Magnaporthiopsis poae ATCC 64411]|uniref:Uncharacterized protein n=1 Tax=Magnaporthiopsis poae (strain ATCC 64411 / 73-15) TaxID=644358 RepID=A0A0C4E109_MAGP6|nr:hypothetical protein MAPG_06053 [Magnaporthiopsis poae ATCC 64411]